MECKSQFMGKSLGTSALDIETLSGLLGRFQLFFIFHQHKTTNHCHPPVPCMALAMSDASYLGDTQGHMHPSIAAESHLLAQACVEGMGVLFISGLSRSTLGPFEIANKLLSWQLSSTHGIC